MIHHVDLIGLDHLQPHGLRATFITLTLENGATLEQAQAEVSKVLIAKYASKFDEKFPPGQRSCETWSLRAASSTSRRKPLESASGDFSSKTPPSPAGSTPTGNT